MTNKNSAILTGCMISLAALGSSVTPARADCTTSGSAVTCSGTTTTTDAPIAEVTNNGSITNNGTATANGATSYGIFGRNGNTLTNNGSLSTTGNGADGLEVLGDGNTLDNRGTVSTQGSSADALRAVGNQNNLKNTGEIATGAGGSARAMFADGDNNTLTNGGKITTQGFGSEGMNGEGNNNTLTNTGQIVTSGPVGNGIRAQGNQNTVLNSGSVLTTGVEARGIKIDAGTGTRVINESTINTSGERAYGVWVASSTGFSTTVINRETGSITSTNALVIKSDGGDERIENFGLLSSGTKAQAADLGAGQDYLLIGSTSRITGFIDASSDQDTFALGGTTNGSFNAADIGASSKYRNFDRFEKVGTSTWTMSGTNNDVMPWDVREGTLMVIGIVGGSNMTVHSGATLGGSGTVGGIDARSGSILTPGVGGIGVLSVTGNVIIASGTTYRIDLNPNLESDRIVANGTANVAGGTVQVNATDGDYKPGSRWTILTASGGVTGQFSTVVTNIALFKPTLTKDANNIYLELPKVETIKLPDDRPVIDIYLPVEPDEIDNVLDQTSGEPIVTATSVIFNNDRLFRSAILCRLRCSMGGLPTLAALEGVPTAYMADMPVTKGPAVMPLVPAQRRDFAVWGKAIGSWGNTDATATTAGVDRSTAGLVAGADMGVGTPYRLGVAAGYFASSFDIGALTSSGSVESGYAGLYGAAAFGNFTLRGGLAYGHHEVDVTRTVLFTGFSGTSRSGSDTSSLQAFGEVGYTFRFGQIALEPFAGLAYVHIGDRAVFEEGSDASVYGRAHSFDTTLSTVGLRMIATLPTEAGLLTFKGLLGWQHAFGDTVPEATFAYVSGSTPFLITGAPIDRDSLVVEAGVNWAVSDTVTLGVAYDGTIGQHDRAHTVRGSLSVRF